VNKFFFVAKVLHSPKMASPERTGCTAWSSQYFKHRKSEVKLYFSRASKCSKMCSRTSQSRFFFRFDFLFFSM